MSEEFFDRLVGRALHIDRRKDESDEELLAFVCGVHAAREALKEMMVGKPLCARLCHRGRISATPYTVVELRPGKQFAIGGLEHIRTDGEEVEVLVVRL